MGDKKNGKAIKEITINIEGNTQLYALWKDLEIEPEPENFKQSGISTGAINGIMIGCVIIVFGFSFYFFGVRKRKK